MRLAVFADCHGNLGALTACAGHLASLGLDQVRIVNLGDYVDYGPRPNETIAFLRGMAPLAVLRGNHEQAMLFDEDARFASARGVASVRHTRAQLDGPSWEFINAFPEGSLTLEDARGRRILLVHGDLGDCHWGRMDEAEMLQDKYRSYDFVLSGHTHVPHFREVFYPDPDPARRFRKKTLFLNPGSVGQPRNHCPHAQYLTLDTADETVSFHKVPYDIAAEQAHFGPEVDPFYRERLRAGL